MAGIVINRPWRASALSQQESIEQFLRSVEKRAYRMAEVSVRNSEDALDIVQEAMLSLVRRYSKKPEEQWRPLFFRILSNAIIDFHRTRSRRLRFFNWLSPVDEEGDDPIEQLEDPQPNNGMLNLLRDERIGRLESAIASLSARQQQAFFLRCWEGFSTRETAALMKCSEGSVKTHYSRALTSIKDKLGDLYNEY